MPALRRRRSCRRCRQGATHVPSACPSTRRVNERFEPRPVRHRRHGLGRGDARRSVVAARASRACPRRSHRVALLDLASADASEERSSRRGSNPRHSVLATEAWRRKSPWGRGRGRLGRQRMRRQQRVRIRECRSTRDAGASSGTLVERLPPDVLGPIFGRVSQERDGGGMSAQWREVRGAPVASVRPVRSVRRTLAWDDGLVGSTLHG